MMLVKDERKIIVQVLHRYSCIGGQYRIAQETGKLIGKMLSGYDFIGLESGLKQFLSTKIIKEVVDINLFNLFILRLECNMTKYSLLH